MNDSTNTNAQHQDTRELADRLAASADRAAVEALYEQALEERHAGRYAETEILLRRAWDLCAKVCAPDSIFVEHIALDLGLACKRQGNIAEARELYWHALEVNQARAMFGKDTRVSDALGRLADLESSMSDGMRIYKLVLQMRVKPLGAKHPAVGKALVKLASYYEESGNNAVAERLYRRACDIMEAAYGLCHEDVANALQHLADLYDSQENHAAAVPLYERILAIWLKLPDSDWGVHTCLYCLTSAYVELGKRDAAVRLYHQVFPAVEKMLGKTSPDLVKYLTALASLLVDCAQYTDAERLLLRALAICKKEYGAKSAEIADVLEDLAQLYAKANQPAKAEATFQKAMKICHQEKNMDKELQIQQKLEELYETQQNLAAIDHLCQEALACRKREYGDESPEAMAMFDHYAAVCVKHARYELAEPMLEQSLTMWTRIEGCDHARVAHCMELLAKLYVRVGKHTAADELFRQALPLYEKHLGKTSYAVQSLFEEMAGCYDEMNRSADAQAFRARAAEIERINPNPY